MTVPAGGDDHGSDGDGDGSGGDDGRICYKIACSELNTGGQVDVSCISGDGWRTLEESGCVGVAWVGTASLIRFVNDPRGSAYMANCTVCKGYLWLLHPVGAGEELLMHYGEKSFWRFFLNSSSAEAPAVQLSSD